jgi:hypothetical protein
VWAVGNSQASIDAPSKTLVLRWNGSAWRQMSSPSPGFFNKLSGVAATSSHDVWTVGSTFAKGSEVSHTLIEHWNGRQWGRASLPKTGDGSELSAVGATSPTNVWAVGQRRSGNMNLPLFLHWNGTKWKQAASPAGVSGALGGVYVISARNAWAAGSAFSSGKADKALLLHWNGSKWTRVSRPGPAATGSELAALAASSAANVWAVGNFRSSGSGSLRDQALALHCC